MKTPQLPPFDYQPKPYTGKSGEEVLELRRQFLNPGIFLYYKTPMMLVEGKGQYVFDEKGRRYLDALGGIVTISVGTQADADFLLEVLDSACWAL